MPFCQVHCPLHNNIPDWLRLATEGRLEEAYELSSATNNMPEICGRICPQDRLCEGNCVIEQSGHGSVTIGAVEKYITDTAFDMGWVQPVRPARELAQSVGDHRCRAGRPRLRRGAAQARLAGPRLRPLRPRRRAADLRHPGLQAGEADRRAPGAAPARQRHPLPSRQRHRRWRPELRRAAPAPRRGVHRDRRLQGARPRGARQRPARDRAGTGLPHREQPQGPGRSGAGLRRRHPRCRRQACRGRRRRRHRHGLRAHRGAPGGEGGQLPLPARPRQHAGLDARGRATPRRKASSSSGSRPPRRFSATPGSRRCARTGCGWARPTPPAARRPRSSRARAFRVEADLVIKALGFDPEDLPALFGEPALKVSRWGTVGIDWNTMMTEPARRLRRRRHRARRLARGLGRARRPRRRARHPRPSHRRPVGSGSAAGAGAGLVRRNGMTEHDDRGRAGRHLAARRRASRAAWALRPRAGARCLRRRLRGRDRRPAAPRGRAQGDRGAEGGLAPRCRRRRRQDRRRRRHPRPDRAGLLPAQDQGCRAHRPADRGRHGVPAARQLPAAGGLPHHRRERGAGLRLRDPRLAPGAGRHLGAGREGRRHPARDRADHRRQPEESSTRTSSSATSI